MKVMEWNNIWPKRIFFAVLIAQFLVAAFTAILAWQAAELYGQDSIISKGLGRGYCYIYIAYCLSILAFVRLPKISFSFQILVALALFYWAYILIGAGIAATASMQIKLLPVSALCLFLVLRYRHA